MDKLRARKDFQEWQALGATKALVSCLSEMREELKEGLCQDAAVGAPASEMAVTAGRVSMLASMLGVLAEPVVEIQPDATLKEWKHPHRRTDAE